MALPQDLKQLAARVSNWGRWGPDDQRGTLNFITPDAVRRGAAAVQRGVSFSLAIPFDEDGPQTGSIPGRINPTRRMLARTVAYTGDPSDFTTSDDAFEMGVQAATHWDALAHAGYEGVLYNGIADTAIDEHGATKLGIEHFGPIVTRGILLDVARLHGVDALDAGYAIGAEDLDGAATQRRASRRSRRHRPRADRQHALVARRATARPMSVRRPVSVSARSAGCTTRKLPRSRPTRWRSRSGHPKIRRRCCRCTCSTSATRVSCKVNCGISTHWPKTAPPTACTSSCSPQRRSR